MPQIKATRVRLSLAIEHRLKDKLNTLAELQGSVSITESLRKSIELNLVLLEHISGGGKIALIHPDGRQETLLIV